MSDLYVCMHENWKKNYSLSYVGRNLCFKIVINPRLYFGDISPWPFTKIEVEASVRALFGHILILIRKFSVINF